VSKFLVIDRSTGVMFLVHAYGVDDALKFVSKNQIGSGRHTDLFKATKLPDMPEGTVARLRIFDRFEENE
jgi:hypothetical protein